MRRHLFGCLFVLVTTLAAPWSANAALIGTLEVVSPISRTYVDGVDINVFVGSGLGDVTALLTGVDLTIPTVGLNSTNSGCEASDFAGFTAGTVALLQRGTCTFEIKVLNAIAAGAVGAIIFNEGGDPSRLDLFTGTLGPGPFPIPVLSASAAVGTELYLLRNLAPVVHLTVTEVADPVPAPEPASMLLLGTGLLGAGVRRWRRRRA